MSIDEISVKRVRPIPDLDAEREAVQPSNTPQDLDSLLADVESVLRDYVILPDPAYVAVTLWIAATHVANVLDVAPYLMITSPRPACGKSRLLEVLEELAKDAQRSSNLSLSVLFRILQERKPTLLLDEFDNMDLDHRTEMIGLLNNGHRRGESALRMEKVGQDFRTNEYKVFGLKAIAGIAKSYPPALESRCIDIWMHRKLAHEPVKRFRIRSARRQISPIYARLLRWSDDNAGDLYHDFLQVDRSMPDELTDREHDLWEGLYAIAESAGGNWLQRATAASIELRHEPMNNDDDHGLQLLQDLSDLFDELKKVRLWSSDICRYLSRNEALHWGGWHSGEGLRPTDLGKMLRPFEIKPVQIKEYGSNKKGYRKKDCDKAFSRYLTPSSVQVESTGSTSPADIPF